MSERTAWGHGLATVVESTGAVLDTWYPAPRLGEPDGSAVPDELAALVTTDARRGVRTDVVTTTISLDAAPRDVPDAYLRLHLLSHRLVAPHGQNLEGLFAALPNNVWTNYGPCAAEGFEQVRLALRGCGPVQV